MGFLSLRIFLQMVLGGKTSRSSEKYSFRRPCGYGFTGLHQDEISPQRNQYDTEDVQQQADVHHFALLD